MDERTGHTEGGGDSVAAGSGGQRQPWSQVGILERVEAAAHGRATVSVGMVLDALGRRTFGPLLVLAGLITLAPLIGDIPGVPTLIALVVLITACQLLWGRGQIWLPGWLLDRRVGAERLSRALAWMRPVARFMDRLARPRLTPLVAGRWGTRAVALVCTLIALAMPVMELVPFSANGAGLALTAFGLSLTAQDGGLALVAYATTSLTIGLIAFGIL